MELVILVAGLAGVEDIQDALDFAEKKKKEVGGGIALAGEEQADSDSVDMDGLRDVSRKHVDAENANEKILHGMRGYVTN